MTWMQQQVIQPTPPEEQEPSFSDDDKTEDMSPDEQARREKVRAAARERQRKHRALVKQKTLRKLVLNMEQAYAQHFDILARYGLHAKVGDAIRRAIRARRLGGSGYAIW